MVIFIQYSHTYLFILFVIIIKYSPWMLHPFKWLTSIDPSEMGIMMHHKSSLVKFTKTKGFQIHQIKTFSLYNYQSSADKLQHTKIFPLIFFLPHFFLLLFQCNVEMKIFKYIICKNTSKIIRENSKRKDGRLQLL